MVNKVIRLDGIWLCSEEAARTEQVPDGTYALVLKDAFIKERRKTPAFRHGDIRR